MLSMGTLTHYNNIFEMLLSWIVLVALGFILFKVFCRYFGYSQSTLIKFIPVVWLIFSLRQWENLLWGFQIAWFMVVLFIILALYLLGNKIVKVWHFTGAVTSGILASFSSIHGLLVWPVGVIFIVMNQLILNGVDKKSFIKFLSIWIITGIIVFIIYFNNFHLILGDMSILKTENILSIPAYFLMAFGGAFGVEKVSSMIFGILLVIICIVICIFLIRNRHNFKNSGIALGIALLAFAFAYYLMLLVGRSGLGVEQGISSRYTTVTVIGITGLYIVLLSCEFNRNKLKSYLLVSFIGITLIGILITYSAALFIVGPNMRGSRSLEANYLMNYRIQSDARLKLLYPLPEYVRKLAPVLEKYNLNVFYK